MAVHRKGRSNRRIPVTSVSVTSDLASTALPSPMTVWERILFASVLVWSFLALCFPLYDTDFWWHLKTGEWILAGNGIPYVDLYTFTDADKPWIDLHWGFQVLITLVFWIGGVPLVTIVKAATYTASVAIAWLAGGARLPVWKKAAIWILPVICIVGRGNERPEMLTMLFLAMWLWLATTTDSRPHLIWYLPLVQLVWVNCHALFVLGLIVGFCYAVDAVIREVLPGRFGLEPRTGGPDFRTVWIVGGLVALACFVNPYFEEGAMFPWTLYRKFSIPSEKEFYARNIGEFQPPIQFVLRYGLNNIYILAELGVWLITAVSFIWLLASRLRWSPFRFLLFICYSHLAWQASRNTGIFALVSAFIACENFAQAAEPSGAGEQEQPRSRMIRTKAMIAVVAALCLAVVTGLWNEMGEKNKPFRLGEAPRWFIHDAARFAGQPGFPEIAFVANIGQAEVYVYHNGPDRRVFMDARLEVCTKETFEVYNSILADMSTGNPNWQNRFPNGLLPVVILDSRTSRSAISGLLNTPTWRLVFADSAAAVFLPLTTAEKLKLPTADPTPLMYPDGPPKERNPKGPIRK